MRKLLPLFVLMLASCDGDDVRTTAPAGAGAFSRFVALGTGLTMGEQSAGVVYESQAAAWPSRLAARMDAPFRVPAVKAPGCVPPLVAPLSMRRTLDGAIGATVICAGKLGIDTLPANNVAISGATAFDVLHTTPRNFAGQAVSLDQLRYSLVLPPTQTQVQAMRSWRPTLVAVELGLGEVGRALASGLVLPGTSYAQAAPWTVMAASAFAPVFDSIADSVKATGAKAVLIGVPPVTALPAWQAGGTLFEQRAGLSAVGIVVAADCAASTNLLDVVTILPELAATARSTGVPQPLSCANRPGVADHILTAADVQLIDQTVTAMNAAIKAAADKRGFAHVTVPLFSREIPYGAPSFTASGLLGSDAPFGMATSLDGFFPSAYGHELLADAVATALNAANGWKIPIPMRPR